MFANMLLASSVQASSLTAASSNSSGSIDLTVYISIMLAVLAFISPIFAAIITNCHDIKIRRLEFDRQAEQRESEYKISVFEKYLSNAASLISGDSNYSEYSQAYYVALVIASRPIQSEMEDANKYIQSNDIESAKLSLETIAEMINKPTKIR